MSEFASEEGMAVGDDVETPTSPEQSVDDPGPATGDADSDDSWDD